MQVELTNAGTGSCTLQGNPTVTFLDSTGKPVQVELQAGSGEQFSGEPVTVASGGHAYLTFLAGTTGSCSPTGAARLVIGVSGAPNTTTADLGSTTFCSSGGDPAQSYPVTDQPVGLS